MPTERSRPSTTLSSRKKVTSGNTRAASFGLCSSILNGPRTLPKTSSTRSTTAWCSADTSDLPVIGATRGIVVLLGRSARRERPAEPVADRAAHHELAVLAGEPRQLLGEQGHALPPRARHARDVGAPEHAGGAEGVVDAPQVVVDVAIGIGLARVARRAGGLDRHVRVAGEREHLGQARPRRVVLGAG